MKSVLFVCLGNICRSPALEAAFQKLIHERGLAATMSVDSCATTSYHVGHPAHAITCAVAARRGIEINHIAKLFNQSYFDEFDYILAVTHEVQKKLQSYARTPEERNKVYLVTAFSKAYHNQDIPDPYGEGDAAFEHVMDIIEDSAAGLLAHLTQK